MVGGTVGRGTHVALDDRGAVVHVCGRDGDVAVAADGVGVREIEDEQDVRILGALFGNTPNGCQHHGAGTSSSRSGSLKHTNHAHAPARKNTHRLRTFAAGGPGGDRKGGEAGWAAAFTCASTHLAALRV